MLKSHDIEAAFEWTAPVTRMTANGDRIYRKARMTFVADAFFKRHKSECIAHGVYLTEVPKGSGKLSFHWWQHPPSEVIKDRARSIEASRLAAAEADVPCPAGKTLRPFQKAGVLFALGRNGTLIADEMGLGKTIQAIAVINADPRIAKALIVCPSGLTVNWLTELNQWMTKDLGVGIVDGKTFPTSEIVIIGWAMLKRWEARLGVTHFDAIILDEAHYMKNPEAQRSRVILGYKPKRAWKGRAAEPASLSRAPLTARRRIALTGTPIENRPIDFWPVINWLDSIAWNDQGQFAKTFCDAKSTSFGWDSSGASNLQQLQDRLRGTVMVRRQKSEVLTELPRKTRQLIVLPSDGSARAAERRALAAAGIDIEAIVAGMKARVELARAGNNANEFEAAVKALEEGMVVPFEQISSFRHLTALAKVPAALEFIKGELESVKKVVVWAHHLDVLAQLEEGLREFGALKACGADKAEVRQMRVNQFQNDPKIRVFCAQDDSMGTGYTMVAASLAIFVEQNYVPGRVLQAEDRIHRIGQRDSVLIKHLILEGTIDASVVRTMIRKMGVIDRSLDLKRDEQERVFIESESREPTVPGSDHVTASRDELNAEALSFDHVRTAAVTRLVRAIVLIHKSGGAVINRIDREVAVALAEKLMMTPKQAALGARLALRYKDFLPSELISSIIK